MFFEQLLTLWAVATSVFLEAAVTLRHRLWGRPAWWALLLPSLWLLATLALPPNGTSVAQEVLFWFGVAVTVVGAPAMAADLVRLVLPGAPRLDPAQAWVALGVVLTVSAASYLLGVQNPRFLTCEDFTISGNSTPPGCTPGAATTLR